MLVLAQAETEPEVAGSVLNALELASGFTVGDAAAMQQIMVYGHTLDSYHALATLESKGERKQLAIRAELYYTQGVRCTI